jgi:hypothetical protein
LAMTSRIAWATVQFSRTRSMLRSNSRAGMSSPSIGVRTGASCEGRSRNARQCSRSSRSKRSARLRPRDLQSTSALHGSLHRLAVRLGIRTSPVPGNVDRGHRDEHREA